MAEQVSELVRDISVCMAAAVRIRLACAKQIRIEENDGWVVDRVAWIACLARGARARVTPAWQAFAKPANWTTTAAEPQLDAV
jgi:hypothetical protein